MWYIFLIFFFQKTCIYSKQLEKFQEFGLEFYNYGRKLRLNLTSSSFLPEIFQVSIKISTLYTYKILEKPVFLDRLKKSLHNQGLVHK